MGVWLLLIQGDPWFRAPDTVAPLMKPTLLCGGNIFSFLWKGVV